MTVRAAWHSIWTTRSLCAGASGVILGLGVQQLAGVVRAAGQKGAAPQVVAQQPRAAYRPGELLVKFRPERRPPAARLHQRGELFAPYTGSAHLDGVHRRYRVQDIQPVIPLTEDPVGSRFRADANVAEWTAHVGSVQQRFAARTQRARTQLRAPDLSTIYKVTVPLDTDILALAADYGADPSVAYAEPNYLAELFFTPNDPFFSSSGAWGQDFPDLWDLHNIQADAAWDLSIGTGVVVAVLDSGLTNQLDIQANRWTNPGEISGNGIDDDHNGFVDDVHGWWFSRGPNAQPAPDSGYDVIGHGTHVAGTIAAVGNNGAGVVGVAWGAQLMTVGIFDQTLSTSSDLIAAGLVYAVDNGADVINMSFGGGGNSFVERDAVNYAAAHGVVLVAAAGNGATDVKTFEPANLDAVIAVGAVDHLDQPSSFSNFGGALELTAPGGGDSGPRTIYKPFDSVLSLQGDAGSVPDSLYDPGLSVFSPFGYYLRLAGTSMAAPHVSGTVALILSRHPEFTTEQVRQALRNSADDFGLPGRDARYGYGRLNAAQAVGLERVAVARMTQPRHLSHTHGEAIRVRATVENPHGAPPMWQLRFGPQGEIGAEVASGAGTTVDREIATADAGVLDRGNYSLNLEVSAADGATAHDTVTITRLASSPYLQQLTDLPGSFPVIARDNAWTDDARTVVWTEMSGDFNRIVARDMTTGVDRDIASFRYPLTVAAVISGDGSTIAFAAPEDLSTSLAGTGNRCVQLFLFDTRAGQLKQLTHQPNGTSGCTGLSKLSISADGNRIAFVSAFDLDQTVGNADGNQELYYWDRANNAAHQVTDTATQLVPANQFSPIVGLPKLSSNGNAIGFISGKQLDPTAGHLELFVYDIATARLRQVTHLEPLQQLETEGDFASMGDIAINADGSLLAASIDTVAAPGADPDLRSLVLIDTANGGMSTVATEGGPTACLQPSCPNLAQFSRDGRRLTFVGQTDRDAIVPPFGNFSPKELFQYDRDTGAVQQLSKLGDAHLQALAVASDGRVIFSGLPAVTGIDPEGSNEDGSFELYLLNSAVGGGFLGLTRGSVVRRNAGADKFTLQGHFVQPNAMPLDLGMRDVSVTLLGANGQLFRGTVPGGSLVPRGARWSFSNAAAAELTKVAISGVDGVHYKFSVAGRRSGLFAAATPYVTVEVQVGSAIFSNAHRFRRKDRRLLYP